MKRKVLAGLLALSFVFEGAASPVLSVYAEEAKNAENAARDDETTTEETKSSNEKAMEMPEERSHYDMDGELPEGTEVLNKGLKEYTGDLEYGEGHTGESTDKALKTGKYGVKLPDTNVGDEYTVSFWMKQDGHSVTNTPTVFLGNNDPERWVGMSGADKGKSFKFWTNNADKTYKTYSHTTITEVDEDSEKWRMYTISQKDNDVSVYVDGELIGNGTAAPALDGDDQGIYLGVNYWDSEFKGLIDDVTIFDEKLSDEQVKYLYDGNTEEEPAAETPAEEETDKNAEYLITEFNFNDAENGFVSGDYKAEGNYDSIAEGKNGNAVHMKRDVSQYLTVKDSNGKSPLTGLDEFTISYDFKPSDSTTSWSFFAAPASEKPVYGKEKYLGVLTNGGNTTVERYNNNGSRSATVTLGTKINNWNHIDIVFEKNKTTLYIDKEKKAEVESEVDIKKLLGDDSVLWIGHANWGDGETLNGYLDNYKIYNKALSGEELDSTAKDPAKSKREDLNRKVDVKIESVEADYKEVLDVSADEAVSLETPAKVVFSDGISKDDASIVWTDEDGNTVSNTNALKAGTNELTGHLQYFSSPFIEEKADPFVIYNEKDGYYYFTSSWPAYRDVNHGYDRISLRRAKTIEGLAEAEEHVIWWHHTNGTAPRYHIWAPELHKVGDKWVVYFAGSEDPKGVWAIRPYAIVCNNPDDLLNPESWSDAKRFTNADGSYDDNFDDFSLDMTTFNYQDEDYVIWAYKVNGHSSLKMGKLDSENPWKLKEGSETIVLTEPEYSWEKKDEIVNEGPSVLQTEDKIFVSFSASGTGPNYCMGLMMADQGSDLLDIENWTKTTQPILQSSDLYQQYGPGHNSFTKDKNGNDIIVYHARDEECYKGECGYAGVHPLYDPCRHAYLAYVRWSEDGIPVFSNTEYKETKDIEFKRTVNVGDAEDLVKADAAAITINGIEDGARGNITLPLVGESGSKITWESSKPEVISDVEKDGKAAGVVTRQAEDTQVILTATVVSGNSRALRKIPVNVKAKAEEKETTHYLFAHFTGTEQIYFSDSKDGLDWKMLNDGDPVLKSTLGEKGLRDPFIMRSPEGDKFYLIATDLRIASDGNWGRAQTNGSQSIMVWESTDLVNWGEQRMVKVARDDAGCTWAPEAVYNDETGEYMVFWASKVDDDNYSTQKIYYVTTRDFYTFSEPEVWIELHNKDGKEISIIDTSVISVMEDGKKVYYRLSKNEASSDATVDDGDPASGKFEILEKSDSLLGKWTRVKSNYLNSTRGVEGGTIFKFNGEDKWCMLLDRYGNGGYFPSVTNDIGSGEFTKLNSDEYSFPSTMRHGTVIPITEEEYAAVEKEWGAVETVDEIDTSVSLKDSALFNLDFNGDEALDADGVSVKAENGFSLVDNDVTGGKAVELSSAKKQWLDIKTDDGKAVLAGRNSFAVNYWSKVTDASGSNKGWTFYAAPNANALKWGSSGTLDDYPETYFGIIDADDNASISDKGITVQRFKDNFSRPASNTAKSGTNDWKMITVAATENATYLYVNGKLVSTVKSSVALSDIFGSSEEGVLQVGKANWGGEEYFNGAIDDFTVYGRAITAEEVAKIYANKNYTGEEVTAEEPATEEATEEAPTEEATTEAPATEEATEEAPTEEATTEAPATEEPTTEAPEIEEPATETPVEDDSETEEPTVEEPGTEAPTEEAPGNTTTVVDNSPKAPADNILTPGSTEWLILPKTSYYLNPGFAVKKYKVSNKKVLSVSRKGKVKVKKSGNVTVTATGKNGETASFVIAAEKPKMKGVKVSVGTKLNVSDMLSGTKFAELSSMKSSKTSVAEIAADGTITAKAKGTSKITVEIGGRKYKAKIKVK